MDSFRAGNRGGVPLLQNLPPLGLAVGGAPRGDSLTPELKKAQSEDRAFFVLYLTAETYQR